MVRFPHKAKPPLVRGGEDREVAVLEPYNSPGTIELDMWIVDINGRWSQPDSENLIGGGPTLQRILNGT
jgi:hypothetical protein